MATPVREELIWVIQDHRGAAKASRPMLEPTTDGIIKFGNASESVKAEPRRREWGKCVGWLRHSGNQKLVGQRSGEETAMGMMRTKDMQMNTRDFVKRTGLSPVMIGNGDVEVKLVATQRTYLQAFP
jgi:hypothetical protein